jgi:hypothetical protein
MQIDWVVGCGGPLEEMTEPLKSMSSELTEFSSRLWEEQRNGISHAILVFEVTSIGAETLIEQFGSGFRLDTVGEYYITGAIEFLIRSMLDGETLRQSAGLFPEFPAWWSKSGCLPVVASYGQAIAFGHARR